VFLSSCTVKLCDTFIFTKNCKNKIHPTNASAALYVLPYSTKLFISLPFDVWDLTWTYKAWEDWSFYDIEPCHMVNCYQHNKHLTVNTYQ
jgi:hypothetical protein